MGRYSGGRSSARTTLPSIARATWRSTSSRDAPLRRSLSSISSMKRLRTGSLIAGSAAAAAVAWTWKRT